MSREKFEQDIKARFGDSIDYRVCKNSDGEYMAWDMQVAWWAWQAASKASEQQLAAVVAENAGLKKFCKNAAFDADYEAELCMEQGGFTDALNDIKTPATDAYLAEVRAQGVEMYAMCIAHRVNYSEVDKSNELDALSFAEGLRNPAPELSPEEVVEFAAQLRQGAAL